MVAGEAVGVAPELLGREGRDDLAISGGSASTGVCMFQLAKPQAIKLRQEKGFLPPSALSASHFPISVPLAAGPEEGRSR